jgi:hypothetical protein
MVKTEQKRLKEITKQFAITFGGTKKDVWDFMQNLMVLLKKCTIGLMLNLKVLKNPKKCTSYCLELIGEPVKSRGAEVGPLKTL